MYKTKYAVSIRQDNQVVATKKLSTKENTLKPVFGQHSVWFSKTPSRRLSGENKLKNNNNNFRM